MSGSVRQVLTAATGAGKSIIALNIIQRTLEAGNRVMFICDRRVLVEQFSMHLSRSDIDHGVVMANHWRYRPQEKLQVASIQTLERMEYWPQADLIIIDEIHSVIRQSLKDFIKANPKQKIIGLTATPFHPELGNLFDSVTNVVTMKELVAEGFLVPFKVFVAKEIDTQGVKLVGDEWQKDQLEERGLRLVGDVVDEYVKLSMQVFGEHKKTICFSTGVAHSQQLQQRFAERGLNFLSISYKDSEEEKERILAEFAKPDTDINGLISTDILTKGFDRSDVEHVILARPLRKSFSTHVQMVGRGARPHEGKQFCVIQDHSNNWLRFAEDWEDLFHDGVKTLAINPDKKPRKEPTEKEKKESKCPACKVLWTFPTDKCGNCGFVRESKKNIDSIAGEMQELAGTVRVQKDNKQDLYSQLLYYARSRGFKEGWAANQYKAKFGVWPRGLHLIAKPPTQETMSWIKHRQIAFAKAQAKSK
jgi:DNA repair protein RadD